ncbi:CapA family protein [Phytohabitans rumicis]|uniref:Capsular polysaccharide biosynthesis protein n=1 Tax=Phytohabitans rumicis TaxID=1076125 RepID=A0A6V8LJR4_9ACTN|nr:CapA family protein [Phytohabitans rumicis]GFJ94416.1 capsular polysaccharide biosynthesis protein [Phytohabitans rumicis]
MDIALAGDTMLGRLVAERLHEVGPRRLVAPEVRDIVAEADLFVVNLECCVSERGQPWPQPGKPFFFRAPPRAAQTLAWLGVDCVTLANNHALDFGYQALRDTRWHLADAGVRTVGAGPDRDAARAAVVLTGGGLRLAVLGVTDHPNDYAAGRTRPGVAYADLRAGVPGWLADEIAALRQHADAVLVTPHWGPNLITEPLPYVRRAAKALVDAGATLVAGHSAHVFHGVAGPVLYDLGDFIDDYAVDPVLHNDLGLLWLVTLDAGGPRRLRAVPLALDTAYTRLATGPEYDWVAYRLTAACAELGTEVVNEGDHLSVTWRT